MARHNDQARRDLSSHPYRPSRLYWLKPITPVPASALARAGWRYLGLAIRHRFARDKRLDDSALLERVAGRPLRLPSHMTESEFPPGRRPKPFIDFEGWADLFNKREEVDLRDHQRIVSAGSKLRRKSARSFEYALYEPSRMARLAFHWTRAAINLYGHGSEQTFAALTLLGAAVVGLEMGSPCQLCYRKCIPHQARCPEHSRHRRYIDREKEIRANVLVALKRDPNPPAPARYANDAERCARVLAGAIWGPAIDPDDAWRRALKDALAESPRIAALLPSTLVDQTAWRIHRALRERVDSLESDLQAWPAKIRAAQAFADHHDPSTAEPIGPRAKSQARVQEALALHDQGLTISEIAQRLGLVPDSLKRAMARRRKRSGQ